MLASINICATEPVVIDGEQNGFIRLVVNPKGDTTVWLSLDRASAAKLSEDIHKTLFGRDVKHAATAS